MGKPILRENDKRFIELILQEVRKIDEKALFNILYFPSNVRIQIQSGEEHRTQIFNKLHHIHKIFGLQFKLTQFIKKAKTLISFDLFLSYSSNEA